MTEEKQYEWDKVFLNIAAEMATRSHCRSLKVGAVVVRDNRILSTGINGTPTGYVNCDELHPKRDSREFDRERHHKFSDDYEIHAEMNAIIFAAKHGIPIDGATLYCTDSPCKNCLKAICNSGIIRVVFRNLYDLAGYDEKTDEMMAAGKIKLEQIAE
jgi:dCMP deaminase